MLDVIRRRGLAATVMNFRSCARDPQNNRRMLPNRRPRFYHSGETGDLDFVVRLLASREPGTALLAFGASLGGNQVLKWLGENPAQTFVAAAATVSVPYDLAAGARHLETAIGRFYVARFVDTLSKKVERVIAKFPETATSVDLAAVRRARTFREFDDAATAPLHGFRDAEDYWARSSSIFFLPKITTPTLCISAEDDPFLPPEVLERARAVASPSIEFLITKHGGHVGFIAGTVPWRSVYWAEERAVEWLVGRGHRGEF
jgi:predicted alpha/beta-fold hydrolase